MNNNFIKTNDTHTKEILLNEGFELIDESGGLYTFLNCQSKIEKFSSEKDMQITFSDKLCI